MVGIPAETAPGLGALQAIEHIACLDLVDRGATWIPAWLRGDGLGTNEASSKHRPNLEATWIARTVMIQRTRCRVTKGCRQACCVTDNDRHQEA